MQPDTRVAAMAALTRFFSIPYNVDIVLLLYLNKKTGFI